MKFVFVLFALLLHPAVFGNDLTVSVIDGWKSKPVVDCEVTLKSRSGQVLFVMETDEEGRVIFSDLASEDYTVVIADIGEDFYGSEHQVTLSEVWRIECILKAKQAYELRQLAMEDSIYGKEDELSISNHQEDAGETQDSILQDSQEEMMDREAEFPGGVLELKRFIQMNVRYPEISRELGDQGRVYVTFNVEPDGVISHVDVGRSISPELDEEAKRLVRAMPKWTPGASRGKKVRSRCTLPITFALD